MVILMHLNLIEFKKLFDTTDFLPFEQIVGFIRSNYVVYRIINDTLSDRATI